MGVGFRYAERIAAELAEAIAIAAASAELGQLDRGGLGGLGMVDDSLREGEHPVQSAPALMPQMQVAKSVPNHGATEVGARDAGMVFSSARIYFHTPGHVTVIGSEHLLASLTPRIFNYLCHVLTRKLVLQELRLLLLGREAVGKVLLLLLPVLGDDQLDEVRVFGVARGQPLVQNLVKFCLETVGFEQE